jgi:hypothetical protein
MSTFGDIRNNFQIAMNRKQAEINEKVKYNYKREFFNSAYTDWMKSASYPGAITKFGTGEQLRADLGVEPTDNTTQMLIASGLPKDYFEIEIQYPGDDKSLSGTFPTVVVTILKDINIGTETFLKGEEYLIVSNVAKTKTGEKAIIGRGKLTPKALGLDGKGATYGTIDIICKAAIDAVEKKYGNTFPKPYIDYIKDLVEYTRNQDTYKIPGNLKTFLKEAGQSFELDFGKNIQEEYGIDSVSLAKIANDFGEILGGIFLFSAVSDPGTGLSFPQGANAALVDFHFDGWDISSKAGKKGGTPSIVTMCEIIHNRVSDKNSEQNFVLDKSERKTYDDIIKVIADPKTNGGYTKEPNQGRQSNVWLTNIVLANSLLYNNKTSGYRSILDKLGINNMEVSRHILHEKVDELFNRDQGEWYKIMDEFWSKTGSRPDGCKNEQSAVTYYAKRLKKNDQYRFGVIFYPISQELVKTINSNKVYVDGLSSMVNRVSSVQQLYLLIGVKSTGIQFKIKDFAAARFQFSAGTGANEPFNKNIGLESR